MKHAFLVLVVVASVSVPGLAQVPELKFVADTLVVQAEGSYEADPDLATKTFQISSQEKELKKAYDAASQSIQRIVSLAQTSNLKKEDISTGALTVAPIYEGDRKKRARSYYVQGQVILKIRDFAAIGPILDGSVEDAIADFRSLTYSLSDEEAAKEKAVAQAMQRAIGRAKAALEQKGQKVGALRYANLDVRQLVGVVETIQASQIMDLSEGVASLNGRSDKARSYDYVPPPTHPQQITVNATVQCAFQIQ